ncbi:SDR family oxidoreductase [Nesterenkonia sp. YGD6]|uniref:SDR family oxidoreductase n=1 Tax=Nesterenkonia sp. YGD6 TaxID=2901231 RepID=UPI001F4D33C3|nr:SDR family oxidoreductase [Nesterenkonia sp. YGD6]MCH8562884.1 SDR family oxidoreductase [Nesterenkonia sp. YGD6]
MSDIKGETALQVITRLSRVLGSDPSLVLHGGGNTSIKGFTTDVTGAEVETVWVKGSGWNLATIEPEGFAPLRRKRVLELLKCASLTDAQMVNEVRQASLDATAPIASIEALLHAFIPARVVLHSHADAIVALTNQLENGPNVSNVLGRKVLVLPYVMPGFKLARQIASCNEVATGEVDAIVLSNHGLFTFSDDPDEALVRHQSIVASASAAMGNPTWGDPGPGIERAGDPLDIARFRRELSAIAGDPMIVRQSESARATQYAGRPNVRSLTTRGTATAEHVIHTKRVPLIGRDVAAFAAEYRRYVEENRHRVGEVVPIDEAPRVILDQEWGMLTAGRSATAAEVARDIALHTMDIVDAADGLAEYASFSEAESFDVEYWSLEQAKIRSGSSRPAFTGEVAIVTGAASGIGRASAAALIDQGAAVVGIDQNPHVASAFTSDSWRGVTGDAADGAFLAQAAELAVREFGGVDVLVIAAGIFPESAAIVDMDDAHWEKTVAVNTTAVARALRAVHPYLALAPRGGRVVLVSSKNVPAPGPGAAAYSATKAAAAQLARVAALEWATDGIRVNQVEPDAVFDTGIWTPQLLAERAAHYGLSVEEYKSRNLLNVEVTSDKVADAIVALCSSTFSATTGAHLSVDGGNARVI